MYDAPRVTAGMLYGFVGVLAFSLTLPASRVAVAPLGPVFVGLSRAALAAVFAAFYLRWQGSPFPPRHTWLSLMWVVLGCVFGFPLLTAYAMKYASASHGAIVIALLPLGTAIVSAIEGREHTSARFWLAALVGSGTVVVYTLLRGAGRFTIGDVYLLLSVVAGSVGYAEGGRMARHIGGTPVICWAVICGAPVVFPLLAWYCYTHALHASAMAWASVVYLGMFSQLLGFFAFYHGMKIGGVARVSQVQLLQPILTVVACWAWLGEPIPPSTWIAAAVVIACVLVARKSAAPTAAMD
jgi:drug/metabolite transporter (DMT)-like permease